jgi:hypothetical protein
MPMQSPASLGLIGGMVALVALAVVLAILAPALIAIVVFLVAFAVFLVWRGQRRASGTLDKRHGDRRVPSTEEATADPAGDSGVRDAARSSSGHTA